MITPLGVVLSEGYNILLYILFNIGINDVSCQPNNHSPFWLFPSNLSQVLLVALPEVNSTHIIQHKLLLFGFLLTYVNIQE